MLWNTESMIQIHTPKTHTYTHTHSTVHTAAHSLEEPGRPALPFTGEDGLGRGARFPDDDLLTVPVLRFVTGLTAQQHLLQLAKRHCFYLKRVSLVQETEEKPTEIT